MGQPLLENRNINWCLIWHSLQLQSGYAQLELLMSGKCTHTHTHTTDPDRAEPRNDYGDNSYPQRTGFVAAAAFACKIGKCHVQSSNSRQVAKVVVTQTHRRSQTSLRHSDADTHVVPPNVSNCYAATNVYRPAQGAKVQFKRNDA